MHTDLLESDRPYGVEAVRLAKCLQETHASGAHLESEMVLQASITHSQSRPSGACEIADVLKSGRIQNCPLGCDF